MNCNQPSVAFENPLELDEEQIKSLDSLNLRKLIPVYKNKSKGVKKHLAFLQNEIKKQEQQLNGFNLQKFELETSTAKFKKISMNLGARENNALQELKQAKVMCPIYQCKMNYFLEKFQSEDILKEDISPPTHWNQRLHKLLEQRQKLQEKINANEKKIEDFIEKYLL